MNDHQPGRWRARTLRRATRMDVAAVVTISLLGAATVISGRFASTALTPRSALQVGRLVDELELPVRLPDAPLLNEFGEHTALLARIHEKRTAVAFYAPWCGPCQKELPELVAAFASEGQVLVVVSKDESVAETRRQLTNIGLGDLAFYVDATGRLFDEARVTALPTTFIVTRGGGVLVRGAGYSQLALRRMRRRAALADDVGSSLPSDPGGGRAP